MKIEIKPKKSDSTDNTPISARARLLTDLANLDDKDPKLQIL